MPWIHTPEKNSMSRTNLEIRLPTDRSPLHTTRRPPAITLLVSGRITEVAAHGIGQSVQSGHDIEVIAGNVGRLAYIGGKIVQGELRAVGGVLDGRSPGAAGPTVERAVGMGEVQFPASAAHRVQLVAPIEKERLVRAFRPLISAQQ